MKRFKQIDILRTLAIVLVLGRHITPCPEQTSSFFHSFTEIWRRGGWTGVDLFFVLSGFLVSGLLFREHEKFGKLRIGHFLIRRGFKIYPAFWLMIGFTVFHGHLRHLTLKVPNLTCEVLFFQSYFPHMWNHTWSLAVEEHFYFLLAIGLFFLTRRRSEDPFASVPIIFGIVAVFCLTLRIIGSFRLPYLHETHVFPSHLRIDSLLFGVVLSYWYHRFPIKFFEFAHKYRHLLLITGGALFLPTFCFSIESTPFIYTYGFALLYIGSGCLLAASLGFHPPTSPVAKAVAYTGSHSYSVYLWHMPVALYGTEIVGRHLHRPDSWYVYAASYLLGSIAFGVVMAILVEMPVLNLRDRLFPSRGTPLGSDAPGIRTLMEQVER